MGKNTMDGNVQVGENWQASCPAYIEQERNIRRGDRF